MWTPCEREDRGGGLWFAHEERKMENRLLRIEAEYGPIEVRFPGRLTKNDVSDFECHVQILLRVMRRMAALDEQDNNLPTVEDARGIMRSLENRE